MVGLGGRIWIFPFFMKEGGGTVVDGGVVVKCSNIWCGCDYTELPRLVRFAHNPPLLFRGGGKRRGMGENGMQQNG